MTDPLWSPSPERIARSNLYAFAQALGAGLPPGDYAALHRWSVAHPLEFWEAAWADAAVTAPGMHSAVCTDLAMPPLRTAPHEVWFPGARFNFAAHLLRFDDDRPALIAEGEGTPRQVVSYAQLRAMTARCQRGLKALGVGPGDRVAGFLPNAVETVVAMLGATSLGAIWSSTSPDFGFQGVMDRFGQIDPKVLFCADGYHYNGKRHDSLEKANHLLREITSIEQMIVVPFTGAAHSLPAGAMGWEDFLGADDAPALEIPLFPFDHPVYILYSSGTTGAPKCIVHGAGGVLLKHHVEHRLHTDITRDDTLFYFTTCGWMMWNWLVSGLAQGCALVLYDGSPAYPGPERLFRLAEETGISIFGTSPKFLAVCEKAGLRPGGDFPLSRLRTLLSTGSPLEPRQFHYVYEAVKADLQLASVAGGTDLIGCFMQGNPFDPVRAGEIQGASLGMDIAALDDGGHPLVGQQGELVCRQPFPSMPVGFWQDPDGVKYQAAYFADYPGYWRHGDFVTITQNGGVVVYGRSDATLNPGGVRIGTAEIYRIVEALPQVLDSLVVGHRVDGEDQVLLFIVLAGGATLDAGLEAAIRRAIREQATPRHVPGIIRQIDEVPMTINGKKVELAVGALLRGEAVKNRDALANPAALDVFAGMRL